MNKQDLDNIVFFAKSFNLMDKPFAVVLNMYKNILKSGYEATNMSEEEIQDRIDRITEQ